MPDVYLLTEGSEGTVAVPDLTLTFLDSGVALDKADGDHVWSSPWDQLEEMSPVERSELPDGRSGVVIVVVERAGRRATPLRAGRRRTGRDGGDHSPPRRRRTGCGRRGGGEAGGLQGADCADRPCRPCHDDGAAALSRARHPLLTWSGQRRAPQLVEREFRRLVAAALRAVLDVAPRTKETGALGVQQDHEGLGDRVDLEAVVDRAMRWSLRGRRAPGP